MVTPELIDYVNKQRGLNLSDEVIRNNLISKSWSISDIDEVLKPRQNIPENLEEKKPWIFELFFVFSLLMVIFEVLRLVTYNGMIIIVDNVIYKTNGIPVVLRDFPQLLFVPTVHLISYYFILLNVFKIKNGSKFSFWLYLISNIINTITGFIVVYLVLPLQLIGVDPSKRSEFSSSIGITNLFSSFSNILYLLMIIFPVFFYKKFKYPNTNLSGKSKTIFGFLFLILAIPVVLLFSIFLYRNFNTDYGYRKASRSVDYHVYKAGDLPGEASYGVRFTPGKKLAERDNAIRVGFEDPGLSYKKMDEPRNNVLIVMNQVSVEDSFDLKIFAESLAVGVNTKEIPLSLSKNGIAYTSSRKLGSSDNLVNNLTFVTKDNVLIFLTSAGKRDYTDSLLFIAEHLE